MSNLRIITHEIEYQKKLNARMERVKEAAETGRLTQEQKEFALNALSNGKIPNAEMPKSFDFRSHLRETGFGGHVAEFTGASAGQFAAGFFTRLRTEVQNGREEVPLLFENIYNVTRSPEIQETETIYTFSDDNVGVVLKEIPTGGEVQWASIGGGEKTIYQRQYARGIEYTKRLMKFGKFFQMSAVERAFGRASNAIQNHIHLSPILSPTTAYTTRNQTNGASLGEPFKFKATAGIVEKFHRTLDAAMAHARADTTYHRPGPYALLVSNSDVSTVRKALENVAQQGFSEISAEVIDNIQTIIAYRGWTGSDGNESVTYSGVTTGKAYLIDLSQAMHDFQSLYSQEFQMTDVGPEHARFVVERVLWDMFFGVYAAPERAVEEITWPVAASGES
jgi:hypothetical protein